MNCGFHYNPIFELPEPKRLCQYGGCGKLAAVPESLCYCNWHLMMVRKAKGVRPENIGKPQTKPWQKEHSFRHNFPVTMRLKKG